MEIIFLLMIFSLLAVFIIDALQKRRRYLKKSK